MPSSTERSPQERATLIFDTPESAQKFQERVTEQLTERTQEGVTPTRDVVAEAVAHEFELHGEAVDIVRQPWEHTAQEHAEAQRLVDVAFAKDLSHALRQARSSPGYPRNVDLLHDALTGELYALVRKERLNTQPVGIWSSLALLIVAVAVAGIFWAFMA